MEVVLSVSLGTSQSIPESEFTKALEGRRKGWLLDESGNINFTTHGGRIHDPVWSRARPAPGVLQLTGRYGRLFASYRLVPSAR